jgi:hypothetical protein
MRAPDTVAILLGLSHRDEFGSDIFRITKSPLPKDRSYSNAEVYEIHFPWQIAIENSVNLVQRGLLFIPARCRGSDRPSAGLLPKKPAIPSQIRWALSKGPDLAPSSATLDRHETGDDENLQAEIPSDIDSEEEDCEYINQDENEE